MQLQIVFPLVPMSPGESMRFLLFRQSAGFSWKFINEIGFEVDVVEGDLLEARITNPLSGELITSSGFLIFDPGTHWEKRPYLARDEGGQLQFVQLWNYDFVKSLQPRLSTNQ